MKLRLTTFIYLLSISLLSFSQDNKTVIVEKTSFNLVQEITLKDQMLDSIFYMGRVYFKNGQVTEAYLNYNLIANSIFFLNDEKQALQLVGLPDISAIFYGKRTFVPIKNNEVAEIIQTLNNDVQLLLHRKAEIKSSAENRGAYGTSTVTLAVTRVNTWSDVGVQQNIDRATSVDIIFTTRYLLKMENKIIPINRLRDLRKLYPEKWEPLKEFVLENNLNLNTNEDVIKVICFCNE